MKAGDRCLNRTHAGWVKIRRTWWYFTNDSYMTPILHNKRCSLASFTKLTLGFSSAILIKGHSYTLKSHWPTILHCILIKQQQNCVVNDWYLPMSQATQIVSPCCCTLWQAFGIPWAVSWDGALHWLLRVLCWCPCEQQILLQPCWVSLTDLGMCSDLLASSSGIFLRRLQGWLLLLPFEAGFYEATQYMSICTMKLICLRSYSNQFINFSSF